MSSRTRAAHARAAIDPSLRASIVHLPASLCSTLLARQVVPQTLIVELGTEHHTYYAGWTGLSASASVLSDPHASECVVLSPALATLFTPPVTDGTELSLRLFRSPPVPVAQQVYVSPLSPDDWEILSVHADEVENNMLAQVRAAKQGQVLAVAVGRSASTVVQFAVDRTVPPTRTVAEDAEDGGASIAVRLSTDTEVIIAPREREAAEPPKSILGAAPAPHGPLTAATAQAALGSVLWRVLPAAFPLDDTRDHSWSLVVPAAMVPADTAQPAYELVALAFKHGKLCVTQAACPSVDAATEQAPAAATASASFMAGAPPEEDTHLLWPERHVWMGAALREKLGVQDGDLVRLSAPPPGAVRDASVLDGGAHLLAATLPGQAGLNPWLSTGLDAVRGTHRARALAATEQGRLDRWAPGAAPPDAALPAVRASPFAGASAMLLTGPSGAGKTTVAKAIGEHLAHDPALLYRTYVLDCAQYVEERLPLVRARFKEWMDAAAWHAPSLVVLDNLDTLVPADGEHVDAWRSGHLARALVERVEEVVQDYDVFVLATAQSPTDVHAVVQNARIWSTTCAIQPPDKDARADILRTLVQARAERLARPPPELDYVELVLHTDGYHVADLQTLTERAMHEATMRCLMQARDIDLDMADFARAREGFTPLSLRDVQLQDSSTQWADIGGLHATRQTLRETLEWPTKYAAIFANCPLRLRSGLLLYGYPGCGKTLLASAVAKECGLHFISVKGPEILNKYIGASEKSVRDLFERAQAAKPCVLFFDEFDSIAPKRGHDSTGVTDRVVNQLLTQMDGAEGLDGVYVLAATSRPDLIDAALLRPGRLDKSLLCDMPSLDDRADILRALARKIALADDVDLDDWARRTDGYSGADLQALLYNASLEAINEVIRASEADVAQDGEADAAAPLAVPFVALAPGDDPAPSQAAQAALHDRFHRMLQVDDTTQRAPRAGAASAVPDKRLVSTRHLTTSFQTTRPSVPHSEVLRLRRIYQEFAGDRSGTFPDGASGEQPGMRTSLM